MSNDANAKAEVSGGVGGVPGRAARDDDRALPVSRRVDATRPNPSQPPKRGALVEDETLVGRTDGSVETREPDGKIEERATDARESRK